MVHRRLLTCLLLAMLVASTLPFSAPTLAQDDTPDQLFAADGVASPVLASGEMAGPPDTDAVLVLQRIELPPASEEATRTAIGPEILLAEESDLTLEDDFGFTSVLPAGQAVALNAGATYTAMNPGDTPLSFLRAGIVSPDGTTGDSSIDPLLSIPLQDVPEAPLTLFVADVAFEPGGDIGENHHAGPIGVLVTEGTLLITSPSGLEGEIGTGQGVSLRAQTRLKARSESGGAAMVIGLVDASQGLFTPVASASGTAPSTPEPPIAAPATPEPAAVTPTSEPAASTSLFPAAPTPAPAAPSAPTPAPAMTDPAPAASGTSNLPPAPPSEPGSLPPPESAPPPPAQAPTAAPTLAPTPVPIQQTYAGNLFDLVPPLGDMPRELWIAEQGALSQETITSTFTDPALANTFFNEWGWEGNAYTAFHGAPTVDGLVYVDIGIHRFSNVDGAAQALDYYANVRGQQMGLSDVAIAPIGDQSRAIIGATSQGTEASVYVRIGGVVIRVSVMSVDVDPLIVAESVAQLIVSRANP